MEYTIYTKDNCNWCVKAKELMKSLGINYTEYKLGVDYTREELREKIYEGSSASMNVPLTVPQIFVYNKRVGGYEDFVDYCENHGLIGKTE